jgi:phage major head subunit gpT-like protein
MNRYVVSYVKEKFVEKRKWYGKKYLIKIKEIGYSIVVAESSEVIRENAILKEFGIDVVSITQIGRKSG